MEQQIDQGSPHFPAIAPAGESPSPDLAAIVASAFGVSPETLHTGRRGRASVAYARQVAMYLAHTRLHLPFTAAGALFGRDRTTARHACQRVEDSREDRRLDTLLDCLERAIDVRPHGWEGRL